MPETVPNFERIVADYGPLIWRIGTSYEADVMLREDLVQQIFLAIWQALPSYRGEASIKTFVARIAQNRAITHVTRRAREPRVTYVPEEVSSDQPTPEDSANEAVQRELLMKATQRLPLPQRQVIILVLEGFSYGEIADMLGVPQNALALRLSRAKAALKTMLEQSQ
ncbi:MAG TPA: sigma-70 family RNA polymerase sigma factor [Allosphingosinicella sp.]|nr:sigma-70 family RNA polymerase sigma factor [Allosphingosinicella sp.]